MIKINKMKKIFSIIVIAFLFSSCRIIGDSNCREIVEKSYPKSEVYSLPNIPYKYIVIDSTGAILFVQNNEIFSSEISSVNIIKKGNDK